MAPKKEKAKVPSDSALRKTQQYALLSKAISLTAQSGVTKSETAKLLSLAMKRIEFSPRKSVAWLSGDIEIMNVVLTLLQSWHRHRALIDDQARPLPIKLIGDSPSVESIIRKEKSKGDAALLARKIYKLGFIRRVGRNKYLPVNSFADIPGSHPLYLVRANYLTVKLLETIEHNLLADTGEERIVERLAHVDNLPKSKLAAFLDFSRQQSIALLDVANNWLESNKLSKSSSKQKVPTVEAGLHVFTFAGRPSKNKA